MKNILFMIMMVFCLTSCEQYVTCEFGARVNNIFNRTNYFNAAMGATELFWFRNGGTNFFADVKYYF